MGRSVMSGIKNLATPPSVNIIHENTQLHRFRKGYTRHNIDTLSQCTKISDQHDGAVFQISHKEGNDLVQMFRKQKAQKAGASPDKWGGGGESAKTNLHGRGKIIGGGVERQ